MTPVLNFAAFGPRFDRKNGKKHRERGKLYDNFQKIVDRWYNTMLTLTGPDIQRFSVDYFIPNKELKHEKTFDCFLCFFDSGISLCRQ
jgi:hypothetical protein